MKIADGFAGAFLMSFYEKQFKQALKHGKVDAAMKALKKALGTFVAPEQKKALAKRANRKLKDHFVEAFLKALPGIQQELGTKGLFDQKTSEILLSNRFVVPSKSKDPMFDPARADYDLRIRAGACTPLRAKLDQVVGVFYTRSPLNLKKFDKKSYN